MKSPISASKEAWTKEELASIDRIAQQSMERIAAQSGMYASFESCIYATKLAILTRQIDDITRKLEEMDRG